MARSKRYHYPGSFFHVMLRGNQGQDIFYSDQDRYNMCLLLQEGTERFGHRIHAFCFMRNHIHLLIQVGEVSLSKIIQNLAFRHTRKINNRLNRLGRLYQGRFKSILIEEEVYFLRLLRYIHRNPVRANIAMRSEDYIWSSHRAYLNKNPISWVTKDYALAKFSKNREEAILLFSSYCGSSETDLELDELRNDFKDGQVLGNDNFLEEVRGQNAISIEKLLPFETIIEAVCKLLDLQKEQITINTKSPKIAYAKGMISRLAIEKSKVSKEYIALYMNRDSSRVSRWLLEFNEQYIKSEKIRLEVMEVEKLAFNIENAITQG